MIKSTIYRLLESRHYWRYASFSEVAELYASRALRVIGMNMASGFASVYLYKIGYDLTFIMWFWIYLYVFRFFVLIPAAQFVARFGPKHAILISNILYIPAMVMLGLIPNLGMQAIWLWGFFMGMSMTLYQMGYLVDFSKVKSNEHGGKELGFMNILEKISIGLSPILGGLIALLFGPQALMMVAAVIFAIAALPLLKSGEQIRTHQKIKLRGFPIRAVFSTLVGEVGAGFDLITTGYIWGLFIAIVVFPNLNDAIYLSLGAMSSVSIIMAIIVSYAYGRVIDRSRGGSLLRISVFFNGLIHIFRAFANNIASVIGINIANEAATTGYNMSFTRGMFDTADLSGSRLVYLALILVASYIGVILGCLTMLMCLALFHEPRGMQIYFYIAGVFVLLIGTARFRLYKR